MEEGLARAGMHLPWRVGAKGSRAEKIPDKQKGQFLAGPSFFIRRRIKEAAFWSFFTYYYKHE